MTSSKPYLIRGLYEWLLDNEVLPYIAVDAHYDGVAIPDNITIEGKVVLNLSPSAVKNLEITNEYICFSARFNGVAHEIYCPMGSILAIYAKEDGAGMMFDQNDRSSSPVAEGSGRSASKVKKAKRGLKIVK